MRQMLMPVGALGVLLVVGVSFAAPSARQAARQEDPAGKSRRPASAPALRAATPVAAPV